MIQKRGEFRIIRVDGSEEVIVGVPTIRRIQAAIGCACCDTVVLDRNNETIMMVDDTGMVDEKPVNEKATALYRSVCRAGTNGTIHGDVAIVNDEDFA